MNYDGLSVLFWSQKLWAMRDKDILKSLGIVIETKQKKKQQQCSKPHGGKIQRGWGI